MLKIRFNRIASVTIMVALMISATVAAQAATTEPTQAQRLARLATELEIQRNELHIPGMALAIVKGDELIYSHGFGSADLENGTPVTAETLFAIGSSTKAFTATLIGMLVDEGKMNWDDPVTKFLPYFELNIDTDDAGAVVTIRDLLSHRTGFTRMGLLWAIGAVSREEVLRTATGAEPWSPFREKFFYNNVAFLAAGMASGVAAGSSWDELLSERLLKPLGMNNSTSSIRLVEGDPHLSRGYIWLDAAQEYEHLPMRSLDAIAPAGAINSNVLDMAQWLRFQLGHGSFDGQTLLSAEQHAETWRKQIAVSPSVDYGLGWMMRDVAGFRLVEHGGNIDGFAAQVALFPEADLGYVLLCNVTATPLQGLSPNLVVDALLADWPEEGETNQIGQDLEVYAGKYEANFGPFKDTYFTVTAKDGRLAVDVPGQMMYQLEPPDDEGKWYFSLTDEVAVSFVRESDDSVVVLKMHQAGLTFELPREGVELPAEIDLSELERYLGIYHSEARDIDFEVKISNQRLAVDVPGQMLFELLPPNDEGKWVFRQTDRAAVFFDESENGEVISMKITEGGAQTVFLLRVKDAEQELLPTVAELYALCRNSGNAEAKSFRMTGRTRFVHAGLEGQVTYVSDGSGRYRSNTDFGRFGWIHQVVSEDYGWVDSNIRPFRKLAGKFLTQAMVSHALSLPVDWLQVFDTVTLVGRETLDERRVYTLRLRVGEQQSITAQVDVETGDLLQYEMLQQDPDVGVTVRTVVRNEDYRNVEGMRVAFRSVLRNDFVGESVFELEKIEVDVATDNSLFAPPTQK